jgi:hypothetical protein
MEGERLPAPTLKTTTFNTSQPSFRFPRPSAEQRLRSWIEDTSIETMSVPSEAPSDESSLGDSTYDFIDTDGESRDGNATESVASTDADRPDDVASLADTEGEDSADEDAETSSIPTFPGLDHDQAFGDSTIGRSSTIRPDDLDGSFSQAIEFEEPVSLAAEIISVKHTVKDLNEEQTADALRAMLVQTTPKRLSVTIRQTMTKHGLSTREPLRLLYVGSPSAKEEIILKIASSGAASVQCGIRGQSSRYAPQLFNVVPISAFGSEQTPEIELVHSSGHQVHVEDCKSAENLKFEDSPEKPDVIKLTLVGQHYDTFSYHSVPEDQGFIVEPPWELPHVAIFYCSDNDDIELRRTSTIARKFMSRHSVPTIVISHKQLFDRGPCMSLDQHSIHMCLESRNPNGRGTIIHRRLPIDLASFLSIDARQMNRNLAYLTGLHESPDASVLSIAAKKTESSVVNPQDLEKTSHSFSDGSKYAQNRNGAEWRALLPVGLLLLTVFAAVLTGIPSYRLTSAPAISINSKVMSAMSTSSPTSSTSSLSLSSTSTSTTVKPSTETVAIANIESQGPNSLAVVPLMEVGKFSQASQTPLKPLNKTSTCAAEIFGDREILIRIPSATKLSWLNREAISVNITRCNITVDTERAYSSDEGIILLLPKSEAYGVLNISIITTRKPRVNETFEVDFGTTLLQRLQGFQSTLFAFFPENTRLVDHQTYNQVCNLAVGVIEEARVQSQSVLVQVEEAKRIAMKHASSTTAQVTSFAKSLSLEAAKRSAIFSKELGFRLADTEAKISGNLQNLEEQIGQTMSDRLLKAQVKSKLLWLKLQGKDAEYNEYQRRAAAYNKASELKKTLKAAAELKQKDGRATKKSAKKSGKKRTKKSQN